MDQGQEFKKYATKHLGINSLHVDQFTSEISKSTPQGLTPYILEERQMHVTQMDVFSRLMRDRIIFFNDQVNSDTMGLIKAQLLFLDSVSEDDVNCYIDSGGGSVYAGLSLIDTFDLITADVATTVTGYAASMGAVILSAGAQGKRSGLKHSRVMIHQPLSNPGYDQYKNHEINLIEMKRVRDELYQVLAETSGNTFEQIEEWCDRDYWMTTQEAKEKGFIDLVHPKKVKK
jgi:ATP-dependent Clp protease protease subunit